VKPEQALRHQRKVEVIYQGDKYNDHESSKLYKSQFTDLETREMAKEDNPSTFKWEYGDLGLLRD
jgi:hypothetical protein